MAVDVGKQDTLNFESERTFSLRRPSSNIDLQKVNPTRTKLANEPAGKRASEQANKQTNKQTNKHDMLIKEEQAAEAGFSGPCQRQLRCQLPA